MYPPNKLHHKIYNHYCYRKVVKNAMVSPTFTEPSNTHAVWITGLFRSGTTILSRLLKECGANFGPQEDLLESIGTRSKLAPDGFLENYLFMEYSVFQLYHAGGWGDKLPTKDFIEPTEIRHEQFVDHCIRKMHDDRISNKDKIRILKSFGPGNLDTYLNSFMVDAPYVKNPHFCLMSDHMNKWWPNGKFVVIFKHPKHAVSSATKVSPRVDEQLYNNYYAGLVSQKNVLFLYYNDLITQGEHVITNLCKELSLDYNRQCINLIDKNAKIVNDASDNAVFNQMLNKRFGQ